MRYIKLYEDFSSYSPIGVLDTGYGGMTILESLKNSFPEHDWIFLAIAPNATLSNMTNSQSKLLIEKGSKYLTNLGCKNQIVACNTACALTDNFPDGTINLIDQTIKYMQEVNYANLGILATKTTVESNIYQTSLSNSRAHACLKWAKLVEELRFDDEAVNIIKSDVNELIRGTNIDTILLACTHYIVFKPIIESLYPDIKFISQDIIMVELFPSLNLNSSAKRSCKYLTCGNRHEFDYEAGELFDSDIKSIQVDLGF